MEEFERGFPNQHTTHRDTRYICMQTFASAPRGPSERDREKERGWTRTDAGVRKGERKDGHTRDVGTRLSAITSARRRLFRTRDAYIHIYTRAMCKAHARAHLRDACARLVACMRACVSA